MRNLLRSRAVLGTLLVVLASGCSLGQFGSWSGEGNPTTTPGPVPSDAPDSSAKSPNSQDAHGVFVVPSQLSELRDRTFYDHPFPSDWRRDDAGKVVYEGLHNPQGLPLLASYISATKGLMDGFSPAAAIHMRFSTELDLASLPADPSVSVAPSSAVQLIDVDPKSPERGTRVPVELSFRGPEGVYIPQNTLAVLPLPGKPLRPRTRYALVVTTDARSTAGATMSPSADLAEVLGLRSVSERTAAVRAAFEPGIAALETFGIARNRIANLTVFTTNDPTSEMFTVADALKSQVPAPTARDIVSKERGTAFDVYEGQYGPTPNYQSGTVPYNETGGDFAFAPDGTPIVQGTFDVRFAITVPRPEQCPEPPNGYPLVIYAHGTGGDYRSILSSAVGPALAQSCIATIGTDQIFHGTRPGAPAANNPLRDTMTQLLVFNLNNPASARTVGRQSAIDVAQEARLFTDTGFTIPASASRTAAPIKIDGSRMLFYGHSQGGINGPLFMASTNAVRGGVLSGTGSLISIALLEKTQPTPGVANLIRAALSLSDPEQGKELDMFHPVINLVQALVDPTDPVNYMSRIISAPRGANAPKSIFVTQGISADGSGDSFSPPRSIEASAIALGLPRQAPGTYPLQWAPFAGLGDVSIPADGLSGNLAGGRATGVLAQYETKPGSDGHFVAYDVPEARSQIVKFLRNLADDPKGRVSAP